MDLPYSPMFSCCQFLSLPVFSILFSLPHVSHTSCGFFRTLYSALPCRSLISCSAIANFSATLYSTFCSARLLLRATVAAFPVSQYSELISCLLFSRLALSIFQPVIRPCSVLITCLLYESVFHSGEYNIWVFKQQYYCCLCEAM
jgi:hypothetical protein